jgi:hypothetical protein
MGKMFSNLGELHRSFVMPSTGQRFVRKKEERDKEATRLKDHLYVGPPGKHMIILTRFSALVAVPSNEGDGLIPMEITEAWDGQDFGRYATRFELRRSVLCTHRHVLSNATVSSGGAGQSFMPIVEPSESADFLVVAHTGVVIGSDLVIPNSGPLAGDPTGAALRDIPFYVVPERYAVPDGWQSLGASDVTYKVVTLPDGRVINLRQVSSRGAAELSEREKALLRMDFLSAILDYDIRPILAELAINVLLTRAMMPKRPMGIAPKILAGPTKEVSREFAVVSSRTMSGAGASGATLSAAELPVARSPGRTLILGDDLSEILPHVRRTPPQPNMHDVWVHGDSTNFYVRVNGVDRIVSVDDLAAAIRRGLRPGDEIRLLSCEVGGTGGPAQQLADRLRGHKVFASTTKVDAAPIAFEGGAQVFVPHHGGKYHMFEARPVNVNVVRRPGTQQSSTTAASSSGESNQ